MAPSVTAILGSLVTTYMFLRFILRLTQDAREPPAIQNGIPFIGPLIGIIREKSNFHVRLRDTYRLPIYTLRLPFSRMYIVNAPELLPALQKQWRTISFAAIAADAGKAVGISKEGREIMRHDLTNEHSFSVSWPKYTAPSIAPGRDLDAMIRRSIEIYTAETKRLRGLGGPIKVSLGRWSREMMLKSTSEAVWGPHNPYRDPDVAEAWRVFESGFLTLNIFPFVTLFYPGLVRARERLAAAMIEYMRKGGYKSAAWYASASSTHQGFGMSLEDIARGELGNSFAVLGSSTPCALWLLYHIFSDDRVLADVRRELEAMVHSEREGETMVSSIDLAAIRESCPVLLSTFEEVLRFRTITPGPRVVLEDVVLDGMLLKKGSMLMSPTTVLHTDTQAWGEDAKQFDHTRFVPTPGRKKPNRAAFRAFGGGHVLCPGRHFASTEIMAFAALLVLQFDVTPAAGRWVEPTCNNTPATAAFPIPDHDVHIELRPRDPVKNREWRVTFSGSDKSMGIVSEDNR
ncbi:cytochrome P450 [Xylariomycetidae sp. FL2044]|nr:cytochrome P450 [Xylariomycetidae sp. FL2044]